MNAPPLLIAAGLLLWGAFTSLLPVAVAAAAVLEGARLTSRRWDFSRADFQRLCDLCALFFAGMTVYFYATRDASGAITAVFQWLPVVYLPLAAAQTYSAAGEVDLSAFFMTLRRLPPEQWPARAVDLSYPYFAICLLCAGATPHTGPGYYFSVCALSSWALLAGKKARAAAAYACLLAACLLGYGGQAGLRALQNALEDAALEFFRDWRYEDGTLAQTAIGVIGSLKQSDRIVLRLKPETGSAPGLVRDGLYDIYSNGHWLARDPSFSQVSGDESEWALGSADKPGKSARFWVGMPRGRGLLPLPPGTSRLRGLPAEKMETNRLGTLRMHGGPGLAAYQALYGDTTRESAPTAADLLLPPGDAAIFKRLADELGLDPYPPGKAVDEVAAFFAKDFRYSLYVRRAQEGRSPMEEFLLRRKAGHCEYFATATALLLRAAGVPARYATGYSIQEYSDREGAFIARQRHAHSWTQVHVGGRWKDLDTTPAIWAAEEAARSSWARPILDRYEWLFHRFDRWRWSPRERRGLGDWAWLVLPVALILLWRFRPRAQVLVRAQQAGPEPSANPGRDSEFYLIEERLRAEGRGREPCEGPEAWVRRIGALELETLAALHSRLRFDPAGLEPPEREKLRDATSAWLDSRKTRHS